MTYLSSFLTISNHLLPVLITLALILAVVFVLIGLPYLRYIKLVVCAKDEVGLQDLAKYLARQTGGKHINVDKTWQSFIPAATEIHDLYLRRALKIHFRSNKN